MSAALAARDFKKQQNSANHRQFSMNVNTPNYQLIYLCWKICNKSIFRIKKLIKITYGKLKDKKIRN